MVCDPCKTQKHRECDNPDTCPCQHRLTEMMADGTVAPQSERGYLLIDEPGMRVSVANGKKVIVEENNA